MSDNTAAVGTRAPSGFDRFFAQWASQIVGALVFVILGLWWLAFYPGISTVDSSQSWDQSTVWIFQDWHPVFYTWLIAVLRRIWDTPAIVTGAHIVSLSAVLGSLHRRLLRVGVSRKTAFATPILIALSPQTGFTTMAMWKDIPFAIAVLWMFCEVLDIAADSQRYFSSWTRVARLAAALTMVNLLRHNGKLLVAGVLLAIFITQRKHWRRVLVTVAGATAAYLMVTGPMYAYLNSWKSPVMFSYTTFIHDMAAIVNKHEAELPAADREFLNTILPIHRWKAPSPTNPDGLYYCRQATPLIFPPEFYPKKRLNRRGKVVLASTLPKVITQNSESVFLEQHRGEFRDLWLRSIKRWPATFLGHRFCVGSLAWSPWHQRGLEVFEPPVKSGVATPALQVRPQSKALNRFFVKTVLPQWDRNERRWITWRAVTWCYAAFAIVIVVALRRRGWRFLLAMAPGFAAWFSVLTFTPGQSARYMFPAYLCALATLPLLSLLWREPLPLRRVRMFDPVLAAGAPSSGAPEVDLADTAPSDAASSDAQEAELADTASSDAASSDAVGSDAPADPPANTSIPIDES